jgi:hypothetical protein
MIVPAMFSSCFYAGGTRRPVTKLTRNKIRKTTNNTQAMCEAVPAIPVSPSTPATKAIMRNVNAQLSIIKHSLRIDSLGASGLKF